MRRPTGTLAAIAIAAALGGTTAAWSLWSHRAVKLDNFDRYVFVPSTGAPEVTVIDSQDDRIEARLELASIPGQVMVSKAVGALVVSDPHSRTLSVINLESRKLDAVIPLDLTPDHMQLSPDGYLLAISDVDRGAIAVVSLDQRRSLFRIDGFVQPYNLTFNIDGSMIYVADLGADRVAVIDVSQRKTIDTIAAEPAPPAGGGPLASDPSPDRRGITNLTRTPNGRFGFVTFRHRDRLEVVDLDNAEPVKAVPLGSQPWRAYATADGRYMLVPNNGSRTVTVIDSHSFDVVATLPGVADATAVDTGWFESVAYVISRSENKAVVLDLMHLRKLGELPLSSGPDAGVVTPDGLKLYVALRDSNQVAVIDTRLHKLITVIDNVGHEPRGAIMGHANNYCH